MQESRGTELFFFFPLSICLPFAPVNMEHKGHREREREREIERGRDEMKKKKKPEM